MRAHWFPYSTGMAMWCTYEYGHRWYSIWVRVAENGISRIYDWVLLKAKFPIFSDSGQNSIIYSWKFDIKELRPHLYFGWTVYYFMPKAVFHPLPSPMYSWKRIIKKIIAGPAPRLYTSRNEITEKMKLQNNCIQISEILVKYMIFEVINNNERKRNDQLII